MICKCPYKPNRSQGRHHLIILSNKTMAIRDSKLISAERKEVEWSLLSSEVIYTSNNTRLRLLITTRPVYTNATTVS